MNTSIARYIIFIVILTSISLLSVGFRLLARRRSKVSLAADDYWIITCAVLVIPYMVTYLWGKRSCL